MKTKEETRVRLATGCVEKRASEDITKSFTRTLTAKDIIFLFHIEPGTQTGVFITKLCHGTKLGGSIHAGRIAKLHRRSLTVLGQGK